MESATVRTRSAVEERKPGALAAPGQRNVSTGRTALPHGVAVQTTDGSLYPDGPLMGPSANGGLHRAALELRLQNRSHPSVDTRCTARAHGAVKEDGGPPFLAGLEKLDVSPLSNGAGWG